MPTTSRGRVVLAEDHPHTGLRRAVTRLVLLLFAAGLVLAGILGARGLMHNFGGPRCQATAVGQKVDFDPSQTAYAATIAAVAERRGLPARAATIAIATAIQESKLRNLKYGDRDSVGLFQQRPSQGWGTAEQILDPVYASGRFYTALVKIKGWEGMRITEIAQRVQKSAYPEAYADHEQQGRLLASTLSGHSPGGLGCRLKDATTSDPAAFARALGHDLGVSADVSGHTARAARPTERQAWALGAYAVAKAQQYGVTRVRVGDREWTRTRDPEGWSWHKAKHPVDPKAAVVTFAS
jgi:hypothetical protein